MPLYDSFYMKFKNRLNEAKIRTVIPPGEDVGIDEEQHTRPFWGDRNVLYFYLGGGLTIYRQVF